MQQLFTGCGNVTFRKWEKPFLRPHSGIWPYLLFRAIAPLWGKSWTFLDAPAHMFLWSHSNLKLSSIYKLLQIHFNICYCKICVCYAAPHVAGGFQQLVFGLQVQSEFLQVESLDRGECRALPPFQHLSAAFIFSTLGALVVVTV